jgi:hypothetical protein
LLDTRTGYSGRHTRFRGQTGLALLSIDTDKVRAEIRYENLEGGQQLFPHIYGEINADAFSSDRFRTASRRVFRFAGSTGERVNIDSKGETVKDLAITLENRPGALAEMGDALGRAGISIEGGGAFVVNGQAVAHFLFADGSAARRALTGAGIRVLEERDVLIQRVNQTEPGQLGKISRRMAEAGVNIEILYSDHEHRLSLVVDDFEKGKAVSEAWTLEQR